MNPRSRIGLVMLTLTMVACAGTAGPVFVPLAAPHALLAANNATVKILDTRQIAPHRFDVPSVTTPGEHDDAPMAPAAEIAVELSKEARQVMTTADRSVHFEVEIVEANAGWLATTWTEEEHADVVLRLNVYDQPGGRLLVTKSATSSGQSWSIDSSEEQVIQLFDRTFVDAFRRCIFDEATLQAINAALTIGPAPASTVAHGS